MVWHSWLSQGRLRSDTFLATGEKPDGKKHKKKGGWKIGLWTEISIVQLFFFLLVKLLYFDQIHTIP